MNTRILAIAAIAAGLVAVLGAGSAAAVTPNDCGLNGGEVIAVLDPHNASMAACTCKGGFYRDLSVFGDVQLQSGQVVHCVGLH